MSERIKNFKIFQKTFAVVFTIGVLVTLFLLYNSPNTYSINKDNYNYTVDLSYDNISSDRVLAGEEVYLNEDEFSLYEKTIPLRIIKKINRLAYLDSEVKEATDFYEAKYSEDVALSNVASKYKLAKNEIINKYLEKNLSDMKYLTASNVYLLSSKDDSDYIKEVVYFIDANTFELKSSIEINAKYDYKKDILKYANYKEVSAKEVETINAILKDSRSVYENINSLKEEIIKDNESKEVKVAQIFIYDNENVILNMNNNSTLKVSILDK